MTKILETPQFTLQIESALRHLVRENGAQSILHVERLFRTPAGAIKQWLDHFNNGNLKVSNARLDEVKREVGCLVVRKIEAPPRPHRVEPDAEDPDIGRLAKVRLVTSADLRRVQQNGIRPKVTEETGLAAFLTAEGVLHSARIVENYLVTVTPQMAGRWLERHNQGNRGSSRQVIRRFAATIREGHWAENGETVKFSKTGRLLDGQTRLRAIVEAESAAVLEIRGGLEDSVQATMDVGRLRTNTHTLEMNGEKYPMVLAPALKMVVMLERGWLGSFGSGGAKGRSVVENSDLLPALEAHPAIRESVRICYTDYHEIDRLQPTSRSAFLHYQLGAIDRRLRDALFSDLLQFAAGSKSRLKDPRVLAVATDLLADKQKGIAGSMVRAHLGAMVLLWNALREGGKPKALAPDTFPVISGYRAPRAASS